MASVYRAYTNQELKEMIDELYDREIISEKLVDKFTWAIFKRHHDRHNSDEDRKEAQRTNALQWYYRTKLINTWNKYWSEEINKVLKRRYKTKLLKEENKVKFTPVFKSDEEESNDE